ncbi:MAG: hypothetical protein KDB14_14120 [Planctomycetales bacterium]|nr:hypothetical protein [Planctomycetales bacterium]
MNCRVKHLNRPSSFPRTIVSVPSVVVGWIAVFVASGQAAAQQPTKPSASVFFQPVTRIAVGARTELPVPRDRSEEVFGESLDDRGGARAVDEAHVHWVAPNLHHNTLYFDEPMLERHGVTVAPLLQPALSTAHFFGAALTLPYRIGVDRPGELFYTHGYGRPGSAAPCVRRQLPLEWDAALLQGAAVTGVTLMAP